MGFLYFLKADHDEPLYKIGHTNGSVKKRINALQTGCPYLLREYATLKLPHSQHVESKIHQRLDAFRMQGEWFAVPKAIVDSILLEYGLDVNNPPYLEVTLESGARGIYRYCDGEIFLTMDSKIFPQFDYTMYRATGDVLVNSEDGIASVNLRELEKDYPTLQSVFSQYRKTIATAAMRKL
jgi:hypothetical protein